MLNLETLHVITARDVIWLDKTNGEYKQIKSTNTVVIADCDDEDDEDEYRYLKDGRGNQTGRDDEAIVIEPEDASDEDTDEEEVEDSLPADTQSREGTQSRQEFA
jgi:hypothetical protein